ncbi:hypothetical protein [Enteroccous phage Ef212]|nr:hypothetical protein [Enteroccous phage Ef212]
MYFYFHKVLFFHAYISISYYNHRLSATIIV